MTELINYDLSIVIPFYKKMTEFKFALEHNYPYFSQNGVEIVLVVDQPLSKEEFDFMRSFPNLKYKIIVNNKLHEWRNPTKVINVGIRHANKKFILVMSPESVFIGNTINLFHSKYKPNSFLTGFVTFGQFKDYENLVKQKFTKMEFLNYGSIYVKKEDLIKVGGYNENFICWGGDDNEVRARLEKNGFKKIILPEAKLIHLDNISRVEARTKRNIDKKQYLQQKKYIDNVQKINFDDNGHDFNDILIDRTDSAINLNINFTDNNQKFTIKTNYLVNHPLILEFKFGNLLKKNYFIMDLVPLYNEEKNIEKYFKSIQRLADGIIILDDGSNDNTWKMLDNYNYTLKVRIPRQQNVFNDLRNRNLLLDLLQNILLDNDINVKWVIWLDCDEIIGNSDAQLVQIKKDLATNKRELLKINLFHMWDEVHYNAEYPGSKSGLKKYYRIFKNVKKYRPFKIVSNKNLHFRLIPYPTKNIGNIALKIKHYGMSTLEKRQNKYNNYTINYDKDKVQASYAHLIKEKPKLIKFLP